MDKVLLNRANKFANSKANTLSLNQKQIKKLSELKKGIKTLSEISNIQQLNDQ